MEGNKKMIFTVDGIVQQLDYWTVYNLVADTDVCSELMGLDVFAFVNPRGQWMNAEELLV